MTGLAIGTDRRVLLWWSTGFALLAVLALVCWLAVRPCLEVRAAAGRCAAARGESVDAWWEQARREVNRLGGVGKAPAKLRFYLRLPERCAPERVQAAWMLLIAGAECRSGEAKLLEGERVLFHRLRDGRTLVVAGGANWKPDGWFLIEHDGAGRKLGSALASLYEVADLRVSPDEAFVAIVSYCEGVQELEVVELRELLEDGRFEVVRDLSSWPGGIGISGWEGRKLLVESDAPLTRSPTRNGRIPPSVDLLTGEHDTAKFSLDMDTGRLAALTGPAAEDGPRMAVECPAAARQFELCELRFNFPDRLAGFDGLPDTQVHDAYDADRDGVFLRLTVQLAWNDPNHALVMTVPGFAMRESPGGPWVWRARWAPRRAGSWRGWATLEGRPAPGAEPIRIEQNFEKPIEVAAAEGVDGPLVAPEMEQNPCYLRRLKPDGTSEALWLFGACRAWVADSQDPHNDWAPHEWLDRETELLAPMRAGGFNLLNQWMAPWEFLLVHRDRAEFWPVPDGRFKRHAIPAGRAWSAYQCLDQGRALAFDKLVRQCEGGPGKPTVHLLLSPLPHQCLQVKEHPWGSQESGWSAENDAGRQSPERLNGFSAFRENMPVWDFFEASPEAPPDDWRSQLFDHQANFWRYLIARWGHSRAVGAWVLVDELDAVGDVVGIMSKKQGWWAHPQCDRWLADTINLFHGYLDRPGGRLYDGDTYHHPLHAATTSFGGQAGRGGNIDWTGPTAHVRPDLAGFHWYPSWPAGADWTGVWDYTVNGVASYSQAQIGDRPRLISEFGAADRREPADEPSRLYPTLYHHAIWAAVFSGQAGTPMDWDDGKEFGELCPRARKGIFDRDHYPIDHVGQMKALRRFLGELRPDALRPCGAKDAPVSCIPQGSLRAFALCSTGDAPGVHGWLFAPGNDARFSLRGLPAGTYLLEWFDPWTGRAIESPVPQRVEVGEAGAIEIDAAAALAVLRANAEPFPTRSRLARGSDVAFRLVMR